MTLTLTKRNLKFFIFILLILTGSLPIIGQTDFRKGYLLNNQLDTIIGLIDYRADSKNMNVCVYKPNNTSEPITYSAKQIKEYRFYAEGRFFVSKYVNTQSVRDTVFLEFLLDGISDLYYYQKDQLYSAYFIEMSNGELIELNKQPDEKVELNGIQYFKEDNRYIGILAYAFADCPEIKKGLENTVLSHNSLISITKKYHDYKCTDQECIIYEKKRQVLQVKLNPLVGYAISSLAMENDDELELFDFENSHSMVWGVDFDISVPRINEKLTLLIGTHFNKDYFYGTYHAPYDIFHPLFSSYQYCHLHRLSWTNSFSVKYTFPRGKYRPVCFVGTYLKSVLSEEGTLIQENGYDSVITTTVVEYESYRRKIWGLQGGAGLEFPLLNKATGFAQLTYSWGASSGGNIDVEKNRSVAIILGLSF